MCSCGITLLPSSIVVMSELLNSPWWNGDGYSQNRNGGEENLSSIPSSKVEFLHFLYFNLSDESLTIGLDWFANVMWMNHTYVIVNLQLFLNALKNWSFYGWLWKILPSLQCWTLDTSEVGAILFWLAYWVSFNTLYMLCCLINKQIVANYLCSINSPSWKPEWDSVNVGAAVVDFKNLVSTWNIKHGWISFSVLLIKSLCIQT